MSTDEEVAALLDGVALFAGLDQALRLALAHQMHRLTLSAGERLFARGDQGDQIYVVVSGRIRLSVLSPRGRELSFSHAVAGDVIGEIAALDGGRRSADATAIDDARLLALSRDGYLRFIATHPAAAMGAIEVLCKRIRDLSDHTEAIALHAIDVRFARLILDLLDREDRDPGAGQHRGSTSLELEISQTELALMAGSTRQRANAALMGFEKAGAIRRQGKSIIVDREKLERIAIRND